MSAHSTDGPHKKLDILTERCEELASQISDLSKLVVEIRDERTFYYQKLAFLKDLIIEEFSETKLGLAILQVLK